MKKYKLTKIGPSENPEFESAKDHSDRKHRGWAVKSPPVETVVIGYTDQVPNAGDSFILYNIDIENVEDHGNSYLTSTVVYVTVVEDGFEFETKNSKYKLELI